MPCFLAPIHNRGTRIIVGVHADRWIDAYLDHLRVERGLAHKTLEAYAADFARYSQLLEGRGLSLEDADPAAISAVLAQLTAAGLSARSQARFLSSLRGLYKH